eukprot:9373911-Alexandrium_andersonii.AAC.1
MLLAYHDLPAFQIPAGRGEVLLTSSQRSLAFNWILVELRRRGGFQLTGLSIHDHFGISCASG